LIIGGNGNDLLFSDDGNDTFYGNGGDDTIFGGDGDDLLYGGEGNDRLYGEDGNDLLDGGPGDDMLVGGLGDDQLLGGPGDDTIWTGLGTDFVNGGEGVNSILSELLFVAAVTVNDGEAQRSNVESISLRFNQAPNLEALIASGQISDAVQVAGIVLDNSRFRYDPSSYVLVIDLTIDGFGGSRATMLADGRYNVQLDTSLIRAEALAAISLLDDDGLADGFRRAAFHRLEGDFDGDRMVGKKDRDAFFTHYGSIDGQQRYDFAFDLNGDGVINIVDYCALMALWGHTL
jgi:Ca2+-binding RTX toxin-like protein